jgi:GAF domain-containing protein
VADQAALQRAFGDYARSILGRYEVGDVLYRLTDHVVEVLGVDGAGVSIGDTDGTLKFVTATDERSTRVEEQQMRAQEGPCHDAYRSGDRVTVADLRAEERWPAYTPAAVDQGVRAVAGIPMAVEGRHIGALNLYQQAPREWPADDLEVAQLLADMATGYVVNAMALDESEQLAAQLQHALDSRIVVEQAKGVIAERHGIATAEAFERIRGYARSNGLRVHDVADAVLDGELSL